MKFLSLLFFSSFTLACIAQSDPTLVRVQDNSVALSEFIYIYEKNNREKADYTQKSVEEYLDLYINFKLKVQKARDLGYHERSSYKEELAGYRRQLSDSYALEKEVIDKIAEEIFGRKQYDLSLRHILIQLGPNPSMAQREEALSRMKLVQEEISAGMSFETAAREYSEDANSSAIGGSIGYLTATLPDGYLDFENKAYNLQIGEISDPVITELGVHLIKLVEKRPARGTIEAAHILIRNRHNGMIVPDAEARCRAIYKALLSGEQSFEDAVIQYSEDAQSKTVKGRLGFFGIGQYEQSFEDAAFMIPNDGEYSNPFESSVGWHIIKRISKRPPADKANIKQQVKANEMGVRYQLQKRIMTDRIKKEAGFVQNDQALKVFRDSLDDTFFDYDWDMSMPKIEAFQLNKQSYTLQDLAEYAKTQSKIRMRSVGQLTVDELLEWMVESYSADLAIKYSESQLESLYPDFKNLMREYEEGILLFEVTKDFVWDKAASDTAGLQQFFLQNRDRYHWQPRAKLTTYSIRSIDPNTISAIVAMARTNSPEVVKEAFNAEASLVIAETEVYEEGSEFLEGLSWIIDVAAAPVYNNGLKVTTFKKMEEIYPPAPKEFREAKGYIISDYQESIEREWIKALKKEYKVEINKKTLKAIIK